MYYDNQSIQCQQQMYHLQSNNGVFDANVHILYLCLLRDPLRRGPNINISMCT